MCGGRLLSSPSRAVTVEGAAGRSYGRRASLYRKPHSWWHLESCVNVDLSARQLMFQVTGAFERSMIRQRVNAGFKRAVEQGKQLRCPNAPALEKRIQSHLRAGNGILKVAGECGVGTGTVQRAAREMRGERPFDGESVAASGKSWTSNRPDECPLLGGKADTARTQCDVR